jgi:hypothetical protein
MIYLVLYGLVAILFGLGVVFSVRDVNNLTASMHAG